jgi:alkanesulfonate monooxygenase SsuD/methylene tetrahydromethanopterin reductase-like flavin-dependent oxidoreductase (luciferase family)
MLSYREHFRPSPARQAPYAILAVAAVCADSDAEAQRLATTLELNWALRQRGILRPLASPEEAQQFPFTPGDLERIRHRRSRLFAGTPATVAERLAPLLAQTRADELMVTTMIYDHAARRHSYELLAQAFSLDISSEKTKEPRAMPGLQ